jgi:hypothetical protein
MSAAAPELASDDAELAGLYGRYKSLALAAAAAAILEDGLDEVRVEAGRLLEDCRAAARHRRRHAEQFEACADAAHVLQASVDEAGPADLEGVRASHRRLRRSVWRVVPFEYVPCCADGHHIHRS